MRGGGCRNSPRKGSEDCSSLSGRAHASKAHAITQKHGERNESCKPEEHRHGLDAQDCELVVRNRLRESPWHENEIDEGEQTPDCAEDEIIDLRRRRGVPIAGPPVCDCMQFPISIALLLALFFLKTKNSTRSVQSKRISYRMLRVQAQLWPGQPA